MQTPPRLYNFIFKKHLEQDRQMLFVTGPRQVGKTTSCRMEADHYLNWDNLDHRRLIVGETADLASHLQLDTLHETPPVALFDEVHKFPQWQSWVKGLYDTYEDDLRIIVTGSSRMDVYTKGGDSMMGRYFMYRMHPFSVAEMVHAVIPDESNIVHAPKPISDEDWDALWAHGGFPEPFLKRSSSFSRRWRSLRQRQLIQEDVRSMTQIQQLGQLELLAQMLESRSSEQLIYQHLANDIRVSVDTVRRWIQTLCHLHVGFLTRPWHNKVSGRLRKEPKWFLRDWAGIQDVGQRAETFIGCHLLKAVEGWTDMGYGDFALHYIRDKQQREVDFVIVRDGNPWALFEVKNQQAALSPHLNHYQEETSAPYAFQVVIEMDYVHADCFEKKGRARVVPARTLLSQLL